MADYKKLIIAALERQGEGEPVRQKRLRQTVLSTIGDVNDSQLKANFAEALDALSSEQENRVFVINGMVSLVTAVEAGPEESEDDEDSLDASILSTLDSLGGGPIRLKKLRQTVMNECIGDEDEKSFKASFAESFERVCQSGSVSEESGMVTLLVQTASKKRKFDGKNSGDIAGAPEKRTSSGSAGDGAAAAAASASA